jgi:hypothetical protein
MLHVRNSALVLFRGQQALSLGGISSWEYRLELMQHAHKALPDRKPDHPMSKIIAHVRVFPQPYWDYIQERNFPEDELSGRKNHGGK